MPAVASRSSASDATRRNERAETELARAKSRMLQMSDDSALRQCLADEILAGHYAAESSRNVSNAFSSLVSPLRDRAFFSDSDHNSYNERSSYACNTLGWM